MRLELCCFHEESVALAVKNGIKQIEFCENRRLGGISPADEVIHKVTHKYDVEIHLMVRPRGGDFCYSEEEFQWMLDLVEKWKNAKIAGFVFGILTPYNTIDMNRNKQLIEKAFPIPCTFHKAIDETIDYEKAVQECIELKFHSILTSGGKPNALLGFETLLKTTQQYGHSIEFKIAGGIRSENCEIFTQFPHNFPVLHSACITDESENINLEELRRLIRREKVMNERH
jgi:copper homeostasis protein